MIQLVLTLWLLVAGLPAGTVQASTVGVVGDSMSTGYGIGESFSFDTRKMLARLQAPVDDLGRFPRLWQNPRSWNSGARVLVEGLLGWVQAQLLEAPQASWVNQLQADQVMLAARSTATVLDARDQMTALLHHGASQLPETTYLFFSLGDLCAPNLAFLPSLERYREAVRNVLRLTAIYRTGEATAPRRLIWISPLNHAALINQEQILAKEIEFNGRRLSCRHLRQTAYADYVGSPQPDTGIAGFLAHVLPPHPAQYCASLALQTLPRQPPSAQALEQDRRLAVTHSVEQRQANEALSFLSSRVYRYRQILAEEIGLMASQRRDAAPLFWSYRDISALAEQLGPDDFADDCLHLSRQGQDKLAAAILNPGSHSS